MRSRCWACPRSPSPRASHRTACPSGSRSWAGGAGSRRCSGLRRRSRRPARGRTGSPRRCPLRGDPSGGLISGVCLPQSAVTMAKADDTPPLVSVIIPTYRRSAFLRRAIQSALAQTYSPLQAVVGHGAHEARDVASSFGGRVTYLWQENQGAAVARNTAAAAAKGSWLALLDDDDSWVPDKLERQFELIRAFPSLGFVHANYYWF